MAKADIHNAFPICPIHHVHPQSQYCWGSTGRISTTSTAVYQWVPASPANCLKESALLIQQKFAVRHISHTLDDFIMIVPAKSTSCQEDLASFHLLALQINLPSKHTKMCPLTTCIEVHGLEVDTIALALHLSSEKSNKAHKLLNQASWRRKLTLRSLQSLIGFLHFACRTGVPGRPFLRCLIDCTHGITYPHHFVTLNSEARADISAWFEFLNHYNGKTILRQCLWHSSPDLRQYSDASGTIVWGAFFGHQWFAEPWPDDWLPLDISFKELFPILTTVITWGQLISDKSISFRTDNVAVVHMINSQTSRVKTCMFLQRKLVVTCMSFNVLFRAIHVPGLSNSIADHYLVYSCPSQQSWRLGTLGHQCCNTGVLLCHDPSLKLISQ